MCEGWQVGVRRWGGLGARTLSCPRSGRHLFCVGPISGKLLVHRRHFFHSKFSSIEFRGERNAFLQLFTVWNRF